MIGLSWIRGAAHLRLDADPTLLSIVYSIQAAVRCKNVIPGGVAGWHVTDEAPLPDDGGGWVAGVPISGAGYCGNFQAKKALLIVEPRAPPQKSRRSTSRIGW